MKMKIITVPFKTMQEKYKEKVPDKELHTHGFNYYSIHGNLFLQPDEVFLSTESVSHPDPIINEMSKFHEVREAEYCKDFTHGGLPEGEAKTVKKHQDILKHEVNGIRMRDAVFEPYRALAHQHAIHDAKEKYGETKFKEWNEFITSPSTGGLTKTAGLGSTNTDTMKGLAILSVIIGVLFASFGLAKILKH